MTYSITFSEDKSFIILHVQGELTREMAMQFNIEAHQLGKKMGIKRYLVDLSQAVNVESVMENYNFAYKDMVEVPSIDRTAIVAMLVSPDDHSHDFIETLSINTGLNVRLFRDRDAAMKHIML
ncbi:MAG: hypothetical protein Q7J34_01140 [Bacteroidales bacterium]|nr:hypothetical protein [Bacteroidales bacterium]